MLDNKYDLIVLGGTFSGIGAAVGTSNSLIIERSTSLGWEYIGSFCNGAGWDAQISSDEGNKIKADFLNRGILTEGGLNFAGASHYLNKYLIDKNVTVLFMSEVISVAHNSGVYTVEIVNESGKQTIEGNQLYNALPTTEGGAKQLNAVVCCAQADAFPKSWTADIVIEKYVLPNTAILKVPADEMSDMIEARKKLHDLWEQRPSELTDWKIGLIAERFDYQKKINPLQAFEVGIGRGEERG